MLVSGETIDEDHGESVVVDGANALVVAHAELDDVGRDFTKRLAGVWSGGWVPAGVLLAQLRSNATFTIGGRTRSRKAGHVVRRFVEARGLCVPEAAMPQYAG
jgi:hypothetical protein